MQIHARDKNSSKALSFITEYTPFMFQLDLKTRQFSDHNSDYFSSNLGNFHSIFVNMSEFFCNFRDVVN